MMRTESSPASSRLVSVDSSAAGTPITSATSWMKRSRPATAAASFVMLCPFDIIGVLSTSSEALRSYAALPPPRSTRSCRVLLLFFAVEIRDPVFPIARDQAVLRPDTEFAADPFADRAQLPGLSGHPRVHVLPVGHGDRADRLLQQVPGARRGLAPVQPLDLESGRRIDLDLLAPV